MFGNGLVASLAHYYLTHDSPREVAAFTVDPGYTHRPGDARLAGSGVGPGPALYPPEDFDMFVTVGYARMNKFREEKYHEARSMGYRLINYVSTKATVWPDLQIGDNCFIMENNVIQPFATLGSDIIMWGGSHVGHNTVIGDHCFLSSHTVVSGYVRIGPNCFLGVNSTVRDEVEVAGECVIGAGAIVTKATKEKAVLAGPRPEVLAITSDRLPRI